jgi:FdhD protein
VSACLLGERVRYDGGHKRDDFLAGVLAREVELVPVCPEVEMGLGTPREPMRLERQAGSIRMVTVSSRIDHTALLEGWAAQRLAELERLHLSGYIFKADSPSCGLHAVKVFDDEQHPEPTGRGLFAAAVVARFPHFPVSDERQLADPVAREAFIRRVLEYAERSLAPVRPVSVLRSIGGAISPAADHVAVEEPLEIRLHDRPFVVIMRTPGADRELAAGFLLAEGVISSRGDLGAVEHCRHPDHAEAHNVVNVFLMGDARRRLEELVAERRNVLASSSCGICGRTSIEALQTHTSPIVARSPIVSSVLRTLPDALREHQSIFQRTGGLHGAALFTTAGSFVTAAEDVGRHNAVDKVIGRLLLEEALPLVAHVLVVSGRTSFEIVQKAWLAGIEIICAVSAPSSLAVELADEAGVTLIGFARETGFNIYTHSARVRS